MHNALVFLCNNPEVVERWDDGSGFPVEGGGEPDASTRTYTEDQVRELVEKQARELAAQVEEARGLTERASRLVGEVTDNLHTDLPRAEGELQALIAEAV